MPLSQHLFSRVATLLAPQPFVERRGEPRASVRGTARMVRGAADESLRNTARPVTVYVQDLSPGGAGMLSATPVEAGEQFILVMEKPGWEGSGEGEGVTLACASAYCRSLAQDLYGIGVRFLGPGTVAEGDGPAVNLHEFEALIESPAGGLPQQ